jgi:hypothetical protein
MILLELWSVRAGDGHELFTCAVLIVVAPGGRPAMRLSAPIWFRLAARVRGAASGIGLLSIVVAIGGGLLLPSEWFPVRVTAMLTVAGFVLLIFGQALTLAPMSPPIPARPVAPPVTGRWSAFNSPAGKVPSHGTHGLGQTYAIDLVYEPAPGARPAFGAGADFLPPQEFPAFGEDVRAPADGRVVAVRNAARDHLSRSSWAAYAYMMVEVSLREVAGSRFMLGNVVILDLGDGVHAVLAHLQRGSAVVRPGQLVRAGEVLARCGNSGNSSEPHLQFQLMDHRWPFLAAGLPFVFTAVSADGQVREAGIPADEEFIIPVC